MSTTDPPKIITCDVWGPNEYSVACLREVHSALNCHAFNPQEDLAQQLQGVEMVVDIGGHASREFIDAAVDAKLWQVIGTGLDHCEVQYILDKGCRLSHTPGFTSAFGLSECAMMYILMLTRKYHESKANFNDKIFFQPSGLTLDNMTLGIIGFGASGRQLAKRAKAFGMRIEAVDIRPLDTDLPDNMQPDVYCTAEEMDEVISRCDFISLHLHLTPETKHIINRHRLGLMKSSACLINVARGALVDEDALADAVIRGQIGGAGIDVFAEDPSDCSRAEYQLPNFIATPHISGQTDETVRRRCAIVVENAKRLTTGEEPLHLIDASMGLGKS